MKYKHDAATLSEALGIDPEETANKAGDLLEGNQTNSSEYIERLENTLSKRELALLSALFMNEILPSDVSTVKKLTISKEDLPEEVLKFIQGKISAIEEKGYDEDCNCEKCTEARQASGSEIKVKPILKGEGGLC
jgi:hypothetical protein